MRTIERNEYEELIRNARLLMRDGHGPKVYETGDGGILKLFRSRRLISSNLWSPYAMRFARNTEVLQHCGIKTVHVGLVGRVPHIQRDVVVYDKLPGRCMRKELETAEAARAEAIIHALGGFFAEVHHHGIYFRSIHLGNILWNTDSPPALIDVADLRKLRGPLGIRMRARNFRHMIRYQEDRANIRGHWRTFRDGYQTRAGSFPGISPSKAGKVADAFERQIL